MRRSAWPDPLNAKCTWICIVLGLSIANELILKGLKVAVVGKDLPEDLDSTGFASPWAVSLVSSPISTSSIRTTQIVWRDIAESHSLAKRELIMEYMWWNKGANWYSLAVNEAEQRRDQYTFEQFARLAKEVPHLCERRVYYYFWKGEDAWKEPWYKDVVFGVSLYNLGVSSPGI